MTSKRSAARRGNTHFDPIDLEVLWNRLITVVDEAAYAVIRTSMSKVVVEGRDFGALLLDPKGRLVAADVSIASKTGTISIAVKELLKQFPAHTLKPGDVLATNNPWWIMGHLNDVAVVAPLFHQGRLVGFAECMAHIQTDAVQTLLTGAYPSRPTPAYTVAGSSGGGRAARSAAASRPAGGLTCTLPSPRIPVAAALAAVEAAA